MQAINTGGPKKMTAVINHSISMLLSIDHAGWIKILRRLLAKIV